MDVVVRRKGSDLAVESSILFATRQWRPISARGMFSIHSNKTSRSFLLAANWSLAKIFHYLKRFFALVLQVLHKCVYTQFFNQEVLQAENIMFVPVRQIL